jgi:protein tyrosine phosphatase (PTP) superfamily phosphohydrolase (DUF442 family)
VADPLLRRVLSSIAQDEARHGALARAINRWAMPRLPEPARRRVDRARTDELRALTVASRPAGRAPFRLPHEGVVSASAPMHSLIRHLGPCSLLVAAIAALPACGTVPAKASPNDPSGNFAQVAAGVYRGGRPDQPGVAVLVKMGVKTIIDLENDDAAIAAERGWAQADGLNFVSRPMNGLATPDDAEVNDILARINDPANQPVFVHCMQGKDRTGLIIALYRVIEEGWPPAKAHDEMMAHGFNSLLIAMNHYFEEKTNWDD